MQHPKCPTTHHPEVPRWYTSGWAHFAKNVGSENAFLQRSAFYAGFTDDESVWWCGHCFMAKEMINAGKQLGYPNLHDLYGIPETRDKEGYLAWMELACSGGPVLVQMVLRAAVARLKTQEQISPQAHLSLVV